MEDLINNHIYKLKDYIKKIAGINQINIIHHYDEFLENFFRIPADENIISTIRSDDRYKNSFASVRYLSLFKNQIIENLIENGAISLSQAIPTTAPGADEETTGNRINFFNEFDDIQRNNDFLVESNFYTFFKMFVDENEEYIMEQWSELMELEIKEFFDMDKQKIIQIIASNIEKITLDTQEVLNLLYEILDLSFLDKHMVLKYLNDYFIPENKEEIGREFEDREKKVIRYMSNNRETIDSKFRFGDSFEDVKEYILRRSDIKGIVLTEFYLDMYLKEKHDEYLEEKDKADRAMAQLLVEEEEDSSKKTRKKKGKRRKSKDEDDDAIHAEAMAEVAVGAAGAAGAAAKKAAADDAEGGGVEDEGDGGRKPKKVHNAYQQNKKEQNRKRRYSGQVLRRDTLTHAIQHLLDKIERARNVIYEEDTFDRSEYYKEIDIYEAEISKGGVEGIGETFKTLLLLISNMKKALEHSEHSKLHEELSKLIQHEIDLINDDAVNTAHRLLLYYYKLYKNQEPIKGTSYYSYSYYLKLYSLIKQIIEKCEYYETIRPKTKINAQNNLEIYEAELEEKQNELEEVKEKIDLFDISYTGAMRIYQNPNNLLIESILAFLYPDIT